MLPNAKSTSSARPADAAAARYQRLCAKYKKAHTRCEVCGERATDDIHHVRGRLGTLECDWRYWFAVCRPCHQWIHANPEKARKEGLLAKRGEWGLQDETPCPEYQP